MRLTFVWTHKKVYRNCRRSLKSPIIFSQKITSGRGGGASAKLFEKSKKGRGTLPNSHSSKYATDCTPLDLVLSHLYPRPKPTQQLYDLQKLTPHSDNGFTQFLQGIFLSFAPSVIYRARPLGLPVIILVICLPLFILGVGPK